MSLRDEAHADAPRVVIVDPAPGDFITNWRFEVDAGVTAPAVPPPVARETHAAVPVTGRSVTASDAMVPVAEQDLRIIREELQRSMALTGEVLALIDQLLSTRRGGH